MKIKVILILGIIIILLAVTNPSKNEYVQYMGDQMSAQGDLWSKIGMAVVGKSMINQHTTDRNYVVFSLFESRLNGKTIEVLGILKQFIPLSH